MFQQSLKKPDGERKPSLKHIMFYWSLVLNVIIGVLLALTFYDLMYGQPPNSDASDLVTEKRPLIGGIVRQRLNKQGDSQQTSHESITSLLRASNGQPSEVHSQGPLREKSDEWKKLLAGKISEKTQNSASDFFSLHRTNPSSDEQEQRTAGSSSNSKQSCSDHKQSQCEMCAGVGSSCCNGVERKEVYLAIMCKSAPLNSKRRQAVRMAWDQMILVDRFYAEYVLEPQVYFAFILGKMKTKNEAQDKVINDGVEGEANIYGDMIVGDFADSYTNLTTKLLFALDWLKSNLRFRYLMMADDDTFINVFGVLQWLVISPEHSFYAGKLEKDVLVVRDPESKWYVDRGFYGPETYPPYHQGFGYVVSCDAIQHAMKYLSAIPLFGIDDTVMGMLMYVITVKPINMPRFFPAPYHCQMAG
ncbi:uncharacterized protein LOC135805552 [Sycon ciliatum]|uniref:uncharacterized protein LOC135805552 n=1 Tax=Sycon ciliatum TaxID=27933 RepID=UPI0031F65061